MLGLKLNHVSKIGHWWSVVQWPSIAGCHFVTYNITDMSVASWFTDKSAVSYTPRSRKHQRKYQSSASLVLWEGSLCTGDRLIALQSASNVWIPDMWYLLCVPKRNKISISTIRHYLSQCWPRYLSLFGITRPQPVIFLWSFGINVMVGTHPRRWSSQWWRTTIGRRNESIYSRSSLNSHPQRNIPILLKHYSIRLPQSCNKNTITETSNICDHTNVHTHKDATHCEGVAPLIFRQTGRFHKTKSWC